MLGFRVVGAVLSLSALAVTAAYFVAVFMLWAEIRGYVVP